jgi:hypothetical protein
VNPALALGKVLKVFEHYLPPVVVDKVIIEEGSTPEVLL